MWLLKAGMLSATHCISSSLGILKWSNISFLPLLPPASMLTIFNQQDIHIDITKHLYISQPFSLAMFQKSLSPPLSSSEANSALESFDNTSGKIIWTLVILKFSLEYPGLMRLVRLPKSQQISYSLMSQFQS